MYLTDDEELAAQRLDDAIVWCSAPESGPELHRLLKMLRRWRNEILAHHDTGASNGPTEGLIIRSGSTRVDDVDHETLSLRRGRVLWSASPASPMWLTA